MRATHHCLCVCAVLFKGHAFVQAQMMQLAGTRLLLEARPRWHTFRTLQLLGHTFYRRPRERPSACCLARPLRCCTRWKPFSFFITCKLSHLRISEKKNNTIPPGCFFISIIVIINSAALNLTAKTGLIYSAADKLSGRDTCQNSRQSPNRPILVA